MGILGFTRGIGKYMRKTLGYIQVFVNRVVRVYTMYGEIHEEDLRVYQGFYEYGF